MRNLVKNTITNNHYTKDNDTTACSNCDVCVKAELPNQRNKTSGNKIQYNYMEKISSDLCGPFRIKTYDNKAYFVTFLDKYSRYLEV